MQPCLTIGYVAKSWGLHTPDTNAAAGLPKPVKGHPFTLGEFAWQRNVPVADIVALVTDRVQKLEAARPEGATPKGAPSPD